MKDSVIILRKATCVQKWGERNIKLYHNLILIKKKKK